MPTVFPPPNRDPSFRSLAVLFRKPFDVVPAPNTNQPGVRFEDDIDHHLIARVKFSPDVVAGPLNPQLTSVVNPAAPTNVNGTPISDRRVFDRVCAQVNKTLSGVSKDSTGAALGNCTVMIFRTEDRSLVAETISDASGNWSVPMLKGGPFFAVEYKSGSPDVAGTSVNTLVPV